MKTKLVFLIACLILTGCVGNRVQITNSTAPTAAQNTNNSNVPAQTSAPSSTPAQSPLSSNTPKPPAATPVPRSASAIPLLQQGSIPQLINIKMVAQSQGWGTAQDTQQNDHILITQDSGHSWADVTPPEPSPSDGQSGKQVLAFFLDTQNAWAIYSTNDPNNGPILSPQVWITQDGGQSWQASSPLDTSAWSGGYAIPGFMDFVSPQTGFLALKHDPGAGQAPISLFRSEDGGKNWKLMKEPVGQGESYVNACCQTGMAFLDSNNGVITKDPGPVTKTYLDWTHDGGTTWVDQEPPAADQQTFSSGLCGTDSPAAVAPDTLFFIVTCLQDAKPNGTPPAYIYQTKDVGKTWQYATLPDPPWDKNTWPSIRRTDQIQFLDPQTGWLFTTLDLENPDQNKTQVDSYLYNTQDGGKTWQPGGNLAGSGSFSFTNLQSGWVILTAGDQTSFQQTVDGGKTWSMVNPVVITGSVASNQATLPATEVNTPTIQAQTSSNTGAIIHYAPGQSYELDEIQMFDSKRGWASTQTNTQDGHIMITQDGGMTWLDVTPPEPASTDASSQKRPISFFLDSDHAWVTYSPGEEPSVAPPAIWYTGNAGATWQTGKPLEPQGNEGSFGASLLYFIDPQNGWVMLNHGAAAGSTPITIYRTQDGGASWQRVLDLMSPESDGVNTCCQSGMIFSDVQNGLITTGSGPDPFAHVSWTHDGGKTWQRQELPLTDASLKQASCNTVSPLFLPPQTITLLMECMGSNAPSGQVPMNYIYTTTDLGSHWISYSLPDPPIENGNWHYNRRDRKIDFLDQQNGWLLITDFYESGDGQTQKLYSDIYRTADGGKTWKLISNVGWAGNFSFADRNLGWATAHDYPDQYALVKSTDGGSTWQILSK